MSDAKQKDSEPIHSVEVTITIKREEGYNSPEIVKHTAKVGTLTLADARKQARDLARTLTKQAEGAVDAVVVVHDPATVKVSEDF